MSDDSDNDESESLVVTNPLPITYARGPRSGLGANRNCAIAAATGDYLLFLDDDAMLGQDFLRDVERRFADVPPDSRARTILTGTEIKAGETVRPNEQGFLGFQSRRYRQHEPLRTVVINAALFPRGLFDQVLFDPQLSYGFDEVDFTTQAVACGFVIVPCFEASNLHLPSTVGRAEYGSLAGASRLYVTLKRRRWTERSPVRAWVGFAVAAAHLYLASIKRNGLSGGLAAAHSTVNQAWSYYSAFARSRKTAVETGSDGLS